LYQRFSTPDKQKGKAFQVGARNGNGGENKPSGSFIATAPPQLVARFAAIRAKQKNGLAQKLCTSPTNSFDLSLVKVNYALVPRTRKAGRNV